MLVTETPACGASSPVSFAASARLSCSRAASAAAALLSPVSIATRNSPKQWPADRLQSLDHAGAFLEQDAAHVPFAPQQLGRQCRAHLGRQVRLPVPPYRVVRHAKTPRHGPLGKPGGNCKIDLRPRRVIADRAAQPYPMLWHGFKPLRHPQKPLASTGPSSQPPHIVAGKEGF